MYEVPGPNNHNFAITLGTTGRIRVMGTAPGARRSKRTLSCYPASLVKETSRSSVKLGKTQVWKMKFWWTFLKVKGVTVNGHFKAFMNSYTQLQTAAIFFLSSLYLKQGIDSMYVMVGFICKG